MKLTLQQLEAHLWGAANILRGKTAGQDYKNYILSLMFYKRLCDQWECEADDAIAELERQQGRAFSEKEKAVFRKRGEHRFQIPDGSRWGDVKAASTNLGEVLTKAMRVVANANDELRGVFTVDRNQPAPDGSGKPLIANEVVHALVQHFDEHDLSKQERPARRAWPRQRVPHQAVRRRCGCQGRRVLHAARGRGHARAHPRAAPRRYRLRPHRRIGRHAGARLLP
jgi:type I restriction enzyme M protein